MFLFWDAKEKQWMFTPTLGKLIDKLVHLTIALSPCKFNKVYKIAQNCMKLSGIKGLALGAQIKSTCLGNPSYCFMLCRNNKNILHYNLYRKGQ